MSVWVDLRIRANEFRELDEERVLASTKVAGAVRPASRSRP
jgi:hypothetical protein